MKTTADTSYFDNIDSEEKAYWLGFMAADGNVYKEQVGIKLSSKDVEHLRKFRDSVGSSAKIEIGKIKGNREYCRFRVCSPHTAKSLEKYGIIPSKSLTLGLNLDTIDTSLHRHVWRGIFDGDGWFSLDTKRNLWFLGLCGSYHTISKFIDFTSKLCNTKFTPVERKSIFQVVTGSRKSVPVIANALYENSSISLDRKREKYEAINKLKG